MELVVVPEVIFIFLFGPLLDFWDQPTSVGWLVSVYFYLIDLKLKPFSADLVERNVVRCYIDTG